MERNSNKISGGVAERFWRFFDSEFLRARHRPFESVIELQAQLTPSQFHAIKHQILANIAFRNGTGSLQEKNAADKAVIDAFGGFENPNMGIINFAGHLSEQVALSVADLSKINLLETPA